jgi:hypothetical protein
LAGKWGQENRIDIFLPHLPAKSHESSSAPHPHLRLAPRTALDDQLVDLVADGDRVAIAGKLDLWLWISLEARVYQCPKALADAAACETEAHHLGVLLVVTAVDRLE